MKYKLVSKAQAYGYLLHPHDSGEPLVLILAPLYHWTGGFDGNIWIIAQQKKK